jgi:hypothetical protein
MWLECKTCCYGTNSERLSAEHENETGHIMEEVLSDVDA